MNIDFVKISKKIVIISTILCILSLISIFNYKLNLGLEFTGGIEIELESDNKININEIKNKLNYIQDIKIKYYGSKKNLQIKIKYSDNDINLLINSIKNNIDDKIKIIRIDYIGAEINSETIKNSILAIIIAIISMMLYLTYRFQYKMALSATITLIHDMILILGIISFLNLEFNLIILSAMFAIFGYSINDTVVIFDRIREHLNKYKNKKTLIEIINLSINSTLSRTIMTSLSTLLVTIILMIFAGEYLFGFSLILSFGIIVGTYSSIYISTIPFILFRSFI